MVPRRIEELGDDKVDKLERKVRMKIFRRWGFRQARQCWVRVITFSIEIPGGGVAPMTVRWMGHVTIEWVGTVVEIGVGHGDTIGLAVLADEGVGQSMYA